MVVRHIMLQAQVPAAVVAVVQQPTDQMGYLQHHIQAVQVVTVRNGQLVLELIMVEAAAVLAYIHQLLLLHCSAHMVHDDQGQCSLHHHLQDPP